MKTHTYKSYGAQLCFELLLSFLNEIKQTTLLPVTSNMHCAEFPALSVKVYVTWVVPTGKRSPGLWVWNVVTCPPVLSVAVGSTQEIDRVGDPNGTLRIIELGHPLTIGGMGSIVTTENNLQVLEV